MKSILAGPLLFVAITLSACGSVTNVSCEDFLKQSEGDQLAVAAKLADEGTQGAISGDLAMAVSRGNRKKLISYCEEPGHEGDKISDLQLGMSGP